MHGALICYHPTSLHFSLTFHYTLLLVLIYFISLHFTSFHFGCTSHSFFLQSASFRYSSFRLILFCFNNFEEVKLKIEIKSETKEDNSIRFAFTVCVCQWLTHTDLKSSPVT